MEVEKSVADEYAVCAYMYDRGDEIELINL